MVNLDSGESRNRQLLCKIARELRDRGYDIAETFSGRRVEEPQSYYSMGILAQPTIFGLPAPGIKEWVYVADLLIYHKLKGAIPDKRWVLDVYGSKNINNVRTLMELIAQPYGVEVDAKVFWDRFRWEGQEWYPEILN